MSVISPEAYKPLSKTHPDFPLVKEIETELFTCFQKANAHKRISLNEAFANMMRQGIDEVIDAPRTLRFFLTDLEKTEKTYIGTKIEILFRSLFGIPKGLLDLDIKGYDVDIKNTVTRNWMIPPESLEKPCILIYTDEEKGICGFGIFIAHDKHLTKPNRDQKRSLSKVGKENIHWVIKDQLLPRNWWRNTSQNKRQNILKGSSGQARIANLFRTVREIPIPRNVVEVIAQQKDFMKRIRRNGGARDLLDSESVFILSGVYDASLIERLGLPKCQRDEFVSMKPSSKEELALLKKKGHFYKKQPENG